MNNVVLHASFPGREVAERLVYRSEVHAHQELYVSRALFSTSSTTYSTTCKYVSCLAVGMKDAPFVR